MMSSMVVLAGCSNLAGPEYTRPAVPAKQEWTSRPELALSPQATIQADWWKGFGDAYLDDLVARGTNGNFDIRILAARIEVARATIGQARAPGLPSVSASAGVDYQDTGGLGTSQRYDVATTAQWEIDVWGKVRKGVQAQDAQFQATEADWRAGYLALVTDIATTYFLIRLLDEQINQQQESLKKSRQILAIDEAGQREGLIPMTQVLRQRAEVSRLRNELLEFGRRRDVAQNSLATLIGIPAGDFTVPPAQLRRTVRMLDMPAVLPSDLLARRPDIVAAEFRVLSAHELAGQARLARLPSINLTGGAGSASFALSDLLKQWTLGLAGALAIPIFDPAVKARIKVSEAQAQVAIEQYRRTVITAFEEVETALVNVASHRQQRLELQQQYADLQIVADQVYAQLQAGMVSQLEVFESERRLLEASQALLANHHQTLVDTMSLYKALGGGWPKVVVAQ